MTLMATDIQVIDYSKTVTKSIVYKIIRVINKYKRND